MWLSISVLAGACGVISQLDSTIRVSCSVSGRRPFDISVASGAQLTREELLATPQGRTLESFFVGGEGEVEGGSFHEADGFTIVSGDYVLGFEGGRPTSDFILKGDRVAGWGGCVPVLVRGDQVASRWSPAVTVDPEATIIPILVEGGGCVEDDRTVITTEIVEIRVQDEAAVVITVWTREVNMPLMGACAGVGIEVEADAVLTAPLGDRMLLDGGLLPPAQVYP